MITIVQVKNDSLEASVQGGILKFGVQAPQGSTICIDGSVNVEIGAMGVYEMDLTSYGYGITKIEVQVPEHIEQSYLIDAVIKQEETV